MKISTIIIAIILFLSLFFYLYFKESQYYFGENSDHFNGKSFFNPNIKDPLNKNFFSYFISKFKFESKNGKPIWSQDLIKIDQFKPLNSVDNQISITFVGHSTFLIQFKNINILTDPIWSKRASPLSFIGPKRVKNPGINFNDLPKIDIVLISHSHYDHLDLPTIKLLKKHSNPQIFAGLGMCYYLNKVKNLKINCTEMDWNENHIFNQDLKINFLRAQHWSKRSLFGKNSTLWGAFALESTLGNIYFAGDTGYGNHFIEARQKFKKFKLALLPIGAYKPEDFMIHHHLSPMQAVQSHQDLNSETSIAMHFETFQLASDNFYDASNELKMNRKKNNLENKFLILEVGKNIQFNQ